MTWNTPPLAVVGHLLEASYWNTYVRENMLASGAALVSTKGDVLAATGANAIERVPVGTDGHALVADSGTSTGVTWSSADVPVKGACALVQLDTSTVTSSTSYVDAGQPAVVESHGGALAVMAFVRVESRNLDQAGVNDAFPHVALQLDGGAEVAAVPVADNEHSIQNQSGTPTVNSDGFAVLAHRFTSVPGGSHTIQVRHKKSGGSSDAGVVGGWLLVLEQA